jgi:tetratricopeptide (TPR) repeat protein
MRARRLLVISAVAASFAAALPAQEAQPDAAREARATSEVEAREADLLDQLARAETPAAAELILAELRAIWSWSGSPSVDLLLRRGRDALGSGDAQAAIEHFTAAIDHAPGIAEAHAGRAAAYYLTNRIGPALDDLREALAIEPFHLDSLRGFAVLLEEMGRPADALEVWRKVAEINPQDPDAAAAAARLSLLVEGRTL